MKSAFVKHHVAAAILFLTFLILTGCLLEQLHGSFGELVMPTGPYGGVGNASAPYSDALGPWLQGSLSYYLHNVPLDYLYRPTVGLFFSSILSATNRVAAIPVTFIGFFLVTLTGIFAASDNSRRAVLTATLLILVLFYAELVRPLNPEALMVDFWAMSFGLTAIWLIGLGEASSPPNLTATAAGFLLLGIVACIRGPQLAAGAVALLYLGTGWVRRRRWTTLILMPLVFAAPFLLDGAVQKKYGIVNNGVATLYCLYATPAHNWSTAGHAQYLQAAPSNREVASKFAAFLFSREAVSLTAERCSRVLRQDAALIVSRPMLVLLAGCAGLGWFWRERNPGSKFPRVFLLIAVLAASAILVCPDEARAALLLTAIAGLAFFAMLTARRWATLFALGYTSSLFLHALLGLVSDERAIATYEVFLFAAVVAACLEPAGIPPTTRAPLHWLGAGVLAAMLFGYAGNFVIGTGFKAHLPKQLAGANTLVKISNSPELDRSLYMAGDLRLLYTRWDKRPFGTIRHYREINAPAGWSNPSFFQPASVEFQDPSP